MFVPERNLDADIIRQVSLNEYHMKVDGCWNEGTMKRFPHLCLVWIFLRGSFLLVSGKIHQIIIHQMYTGGENVHFVRHSTSLL